MTEPVRVLGISYYMNAPPVSGGSLRILSPLMKMPPSSDLRIDYIFSSCSQEDADANKAFLERLPVIGYAEGVVVRYYLTVYEGCPKGFSEDVWQTMSTELKDRAVELVKKNKYDIIQIEHSQLSWIVPYLRKASPKSYIILDSHNIEHMIFEKWLPYASDATRKQIEAKYESLKSWETKVWGWYDAAITVSPVEAEILHEHGLKETYLVPTGGGIDTEKYAPADDARERPLDLLYIGTMNWFPNAHGLLWFIENVFPKILKARPNTVLNIVGSGQPDNRLFAVSKRHDNIKFWGQQKDDVHFFQSSKVFIVPLWIGAGARVKVLTAWASKIPIVSTVFGAEGSYSVSGENIYLADDPQEFADDVIKLLNDPDECRRISDNAFRILEERYTVQCCVDILTDAYRRMAENNKRRIEG